MTISVVLAAFFGLLFLAGSGPLAGLISALVVAALGLTLSWFLRRRFRAWRYQERHEDLIVAPASWCNGSPLCPTGGCSSSR